MTVPEFFTRVWEMHLGRVHGPLTFRLIIQPLVAVFFAIRIGLHDAREGHEPYTFWHVFYKPERRAEMFRMAWKDIRNVFIAAVVVDVIYELIVFRGIYPGQALIVGTVLTVIPYLLIRGPITRIARLFIRRTRSSHDKSN
ncbi:MAG: hypothetical protein WBR29_12475 [Gammaproteobacteria bacterium]